MATKASLESRSRERSAPVDRPWRKVAYYVLPPAIIFCLTIGLWEWASRAELVARIVLPAPSSIFGAFWTLVQEEFFYDHFFTTMSETVLGYAIGVMGGFSLGVLTFLSPFARRVVTPYAVVVESLPKIILAPIFLIWFGYGISSKIVLIVLIVFFPVYLNTMAGLGNSSEEERWLLKVSGASRWQTFNKLLFPNALPNIFVGIKNGLVGAFIGAIVSEFVGARAGLGVLVKTYNEQLRTEYVYAIVVVMALLSLFFFLTLELLDRKVVFWRHTNRSS